ncbi:MAG: efflux transporter outer membrane subunit [Opitutaceae bacterium]
MNPIRIHLIAVTVAVGLAGCTVGPDYEQPETSLPASFRQAGAAGTAEPRVDWWASFADPQLTQLVEGALETNLDLQAAEARVRQARAEWSVVAGASQPSLNAGAQAGRNSASLNNPQYTILPDGIPNTLNDFKAGFDASWEVDLFGYNRRSNEAAEARFGQVQERRNAVALTVAGEVAAQYVEYRVAQHRLAVLRETIDLQADTLRLARIRSEAGVGTDFDAARAEAEWRSLRAQLPPLEARRLASVQALAVLTGRESSGLENELALFGPVPVPAELPPVGLPSDLLTRRPDIRLAERQLAAATADVGAAVAGQFPRFSLVGTLGLESVEAGDFTDSASRYWSIGSGLVWPLFNGGRLKNQEEAKRQAAEAALLDYRQTVLRALADVETVLIRYRRQEETARELEAARDAASRAVGWARQRYQAGENPLTDVLDAQRQLNQVTDQLARLEGDIALSHVALNKALGGGWQGEGPVEVSVADTVSLR